jgi:hypothetical protein
MHTNGRWSRFRAGGSRQVLPSGVQGKRLMSTCLCTATRDGCPGYVAPTSHVLTCSWVSGPRPSNKVIRPGAIVVQSPRTSLPAPWFLPALYPQMPRRQPPTFWDARAAGPAAARGKDSNQDTQAARTGELVVPTEADPATRTSHARASFLLFLFRWPVWAGEEEGTLVEGGFRVPGLAILPRQVFLCKSRKVEKPPCRLLGRLL